MGRGATATQGLILFRHLSYISLFILGKYRAVGRVIRAKHLKERLVIRDSTFKETETTGAANPIKLLEIIADTLYIKVTEPFNVIEHRQYGVQRNPI